MRQNRATLCGCGGDFCTARANSRTLHFLGPRCPISLRSRIASDSDFLCDQKAGKTHSECGNAWRYPSLQEKIASKWRCVILVHSKPHLFPELQPLIPLSLPLDFLVSCFCDVPCFSGGVIPKTLGKRKQKRPPKRQGNAQKEKNKEIPPKKGKGDQETPRVSFLLVLWPLAVLPSKGIARQPGKHAGISTKRSRKSLVATLAVMVSWAPKHWEKVISQVP